MAERKGVSVHHPVEVRVTRAAERVTSACRDGSISRDTALLDLLVGAARRGSYLHLVGTVGNEAQGMLEHLSALLRMCGQEGIRRVVVHALTPPLEEETVGSVRASLEEVEGICRGLELGGLGTVSSRRWARVSEGDGVGLAKLHASMTGRWSTRHRVGQVARATEAIADGSADVEPVMVGRDEVSALGRRVSLSDTVLFWDHDPEGVCDLAEAFAAPTYRAFDRGPRVVGEVGLLCGRVSGPNDLWRVVFA